MENGGNNNVWWDLAHLGLGEEEAEDGAGTSQPYDDWTSSNVGLMKSHDQQMVVEEEVVVVNSMNPPISNGGGGVEKKAVKQHQYLYSSCTNSLYSAGSSHMYPDPHLTCLNLGGNTNHNKRRQYYYEDGTSNIISTTTTTATALGKKGKCYSTTGSSGGFGGGSAAAAVVIPRCQVDGCHVELLVAREYHRRHKVCEMHSKAIKVEVLGIQQRFCQQCSRFHVMTEFDDLKRSCRRRLAGHNERRRKITSTNSSSSSSNDSTTITSTTARKCFDQGGAGVLPHTKTPSPPRVSNALSLLSTLGVSSATDLIPGKNSTAVAIQDLFAESRANIVASQLFLSQPINKDIKSKKAS